MAQNLFFIVYHPTTSKLASPPPPVPEEKKKKKKAKTKNKQKNKQKKQQLTSKQQNKKDDNTKSIIIKRLKKKKKMQTFPLNAELPFRAVQDERTVKILLQRFNFVPNHNLNEPDSVKIQITKTLQCFLGSQQDIKRHSSDILSQT